MVEKTKRAFKNGQYRDTCNIGHKTQNKDKQNKKTHYNFALFHLRVQVTYDP